MLTAEGEDMDNLPKPFKLRRHIEAQRGSRSGGWPLPKADAEEKP